MFYAKWANPIGLFFQILKTIRIFLFSTQIILYFCRVIASCTNFFVRYTINKLFNISYVRALYKRVRLHSMAQAATQYVSRVDSLNLAQYCSLDFKNITQHAIKSRGWSISFKGIHVTVCSWRQKSFSTKHVVLRIVEITKKNLRNWRRYCWLMEKIVWTSWILREFSLQKKSNHIF